MSAERRTTVATDVVLDPSLSTNARVLYAVLESYTDHTGQAKVTRRALAAALGRSVETVDRAAGELRAAGVITVTGSGQGPSTWSIHAAREAL